MASYNGHWYRRVLEGAVVWKCVVINYSDHNLVCTFRLLPNCMIFIIKIATKGLRESAVVENAKPLILIQERHQLSVVPTVCRVSALVRLSHLS